MSNHHLPAGQILQRGGPAGGMGTGPGMDGMGGYNGGGAGQRGRRPPQHQQQHHHHGGAHQYMPHYAHHQMNSMHAGYMGYPPQGYYGMPPQYQHGGYQNGGYPNGGMPSPGYMPYQQNYPRSPTMHQYVPMMGVSVQPNAYPRPSQQQPSPSLATPYQPPQSALVPVPPGTPSSTPSSQQQHPPTPPTPHHVPSSQLPSAAAPIFVPEPTTPATVPDVDPQEPFRPPLPWFSHPELDFPVRRSRSRRRRRNVTQMTESVSLPVDLHGANGKYATNVATASTEPATQSVNNPATSGNTKDEPKQPVANASLESTQSKGATDTDSTQVEQDESVTAKTDGAEVEDPQDAPVPVRVPPTSWANLFAKPTFRAPQSNGNDIEGHSQDGNATEGPLGLNGASAKPDPRSLAQALRDYRVGDEHRVSFLEPRGLINTGNMCYMNSVLQVLMFCVPFYDFLERVSKRAAHSFKSNTPLVDAMIMFMREYKVLRSAASKEALQRILKPEELEKYGEPFTPEFVYEAIRQLSRFASMRRGHQQDAEEFLGFLLQSLDDECATVMTQAASTGDSTRDGSASEASVEPSGDWLEVGRKQKAAVSRSSGSNSSTPITKMFGGLLRSEFRVPGLKDSITTEPYQPLQLDIGSPDVRDVVDALRGLTRPERLQGDFNSPRGKDVMATKQVFIETLPPVLILHLKRFQFDAEGNGTVKIWKKVGYPLELEIPREALSRQKRQTLGDGPMPKYKLISAIYHHGKNATAGHYTTDVRRQEDNEWIRLDDTVIRRVRAEDVAQVGSDDDNKPSRRGSPAPAASRTAANRFETMNDDDEGEEEEEEWKEVPASSGGKKQWSSVVNGGGAQTQKGKQTKENVKDNKVAYLLFYQRI